MTAQHKEWKDPDSDVNIPKTIKKTAVSWLVAGLLMVLCLGVLALGDARVDDKLKNYATTEQLNSYAKQVKDMQETLGVMDRKLDHLEYVLEYNQEHNKVLSPKQQGY